MGFGRMWVSGMGTEVQSKIHLLGYHSIKDLNGNASGGEWPLHHESKSLRNGQFHNLFSTKPASDPFPGSDKDKLKQTILKHESIFRHQLHELHRLYKKQADLMNEIRSQEPHDHSHFNTKGKVMQCSRDRSQNGETLKDCELLESECKRPKKLLIDLERPADEYIDSEEEQLGVSGVENHSSNQNYFRETVKSGSDGAASDFNPYLSRTRDFTDLNQPVQFEKASTSTSVHVPIPPSVVTCSKEEKQSWYLPANSHSAFQYSSAELSSFHRGGEGTRNLHLQNGWNKKDQFPGRTLSGKKEFYEHETVLRPDPRTGEHQSKRTIFGVDISDGDRNASSMASHTAALHLPVTQSGLINSETVFVASQRRLPSTLSQLLAVKEHHCSNSSTYPNNAQGGLSWYREMLLNISQASKEKEGSDNYNVEKSQNRFANRDDLRKSLSQGQAQNFSSAMPDHFCEDGRNKVSEYSRSSSSIIGLPVSYKAREELSSCSFPARPNHLLSAIGGDNFAKVEFFETDAEVQVVDNGLVNRDTEFRPCIDLNLCVTEEQDSQTPSSPKLDLNTCVEIDLEVDLQVGAEVGVTHKEHTRDAAEALVAISSSLLHNIEGYVTCNGSEVTPCNNSLNWFAELVTLHNNDLENGFETVSAKGDHCEEELNHNGIDYFELMTLSLEETKVEESYKFEPEAQEECNDEKAMSKRGRRGQARRGRQRKDFQRDVLPGLISLSRYEVTDDLQIIEGLIGASGGNWQSSLSRRNGAKSGRGRGRRNSTASATSTVASPCPTQIQEPKLNTKGLEEKSLVSWGKRTRRLPRQRCLNPVTNPRIPVT